MVYCNHLPDHPYVIPWSYAGPPLCNTVIIWRDPPPYPWLRNMCTTPYHHHHLPLSPDVLLRVPSGFVHRHLHRHLRDIQQAALLSLSSSTTFLLVTIVLYLFEISYSSSPILIIRRYSYLCSAVQSNCVTGGKPLIFDENLNFDEFDNAFDNSDGMVLIRITWLSWSLDELISTWLYHESQAQRYRTTKGSFWAKEN